MEARSEGISSYLEKHPYFAVILGMHQVQRRSAVRKQTRPLRIDVPKLEKCTNLKGRSVPIELQQPTSPSGISTVALSLAKEVTEAGSGGRGVGFAGATVGCNIGQSRSIDQ
jgi:hypothetical protein